LKVSPSAGPARAGVVVCGAGILHQNKPRFVAGISQSHRPTLVEPTIASRKDAVSAMHARIESRRAENESIGILHRTDCLIEGFQRTQTMM